MAEEMTPRVERIGSASGSRLSYKFQRLREQIRLAITRGELAGQLPGERELGRRFEANAKTINKALCDLSSEGLLVRIIGRGTFVADPAGSAAIGATSKIFHVFRPSVSNTSTDKDHLLDLLRETMLRQGHRLELIPHESRKDHKSIDLCAWPTSLRRLSAGLVFQPSDPLGSCTGLPGDDVLSEAWRRHIPVVLLAAASNGAKVNAVIPDYFGAGFWLTEHLCMLGCERVVLLRTRAEGRESDMVATGSRTAAMRHDRHIHELNLTEESDWVGGLMGDSSPTKPTTREGAKRRRTTGLICIGGKSLDAARADPTIATLVASGEWVLSSVLEPGASAGEETNITTFDFDVAKIVGWVTRLLAETKPGQRPVEVLVPGELRVRGEAPANGRHQGASIKPTSHRKQSDRSNGRHAEVMI